MPRRATRASTRRGNRCHQSGVHGFTLVEVLVAILILGLVITTSLAVFLERTRRLQQASEMILAYQSLSNEAEVRRRIDFHELDGAKPTFISDVSLLAPLANVQTGAAVVQESQTRKRVSLTVSWRGGKQHATISLIRVDTGGSNLW